MSKYIDTLGLQNLFGKSARTIDRWVSDPKLNFPQPLYIRRRRYWKLSDIDAFMERQRSKGSS